ncbi:hypothetical protein J5N97_027751 [Dioscorea zingiberensis]|uniref:Uncharacterized protein n=1 Tax=Dioscorea zingiberensis TaxID=325984 RepID=A0A9D5H491_9LILI|nr:hypothetical protein J5N97_027751 [Dioscorea zingiberensis]
MPEMQLKRQGLPGNKYRLMMGDMKDEKKSFKEAWSRPMELTHRIAARVPPTAKNKRRMFIDGEIKRMLRDIIHKKLDSMKIGENTDDDLLGLLLQSDTMNVAIKIKTRKTMGSRIDDVIEECKLFYYRQETTSILLTGH